MNCALSEKSLGRLLSLFIADISRFKVDILFSEKKLIKKIPTLSRNISRTEQPSSLPNDFSDRAHFILSEYIHL